MAPSELDRWFLEVFLFFTWKVPIRAAEGLGGMTCPFSSLEIRNVFFSGSFEWFLFLEGIQSIFGIF